VSEELIAAYREIYDVVIPDLDYYIRQIDFRDGCPVNTDPRAYMIALHAGNLMEGYRIARGPNPFASICGMICGAPCEMSCRRDRVDKTLTIRAQKRYLTNGSASTKQPTLNPWNSAMHAAPQHKRPTD
jgi:formate dehydrogenase (NADP+) beta subunit